MVGSDGGGSEVVYYREDGLDLTVDDVCFMVVGLGQGGEDSILDVETSLAFVIILYASPLLPAVEGEFSILGVAESAMEKILAGGGSSSNEGDGIVINHYKLGYSFVFVLGLNSTSACRLSEQCLNVTNLTSVINYLVM